MTRAKGKVNASDEVKSLKNVNNDLLMTVQNLRKQIDESRNMLQMSEGSSKGLHTEISKDRNQRASCEEAMKSTIGELNNELTQARRLSESHANLCTQLAQDKEDLEIKLEECNCEIEKLKSLNKLKESNDKTQRLQSLKNELNQTRILCESHEKLCCQLGQEKKMLENKVKECNRVIEELQRKMTEDEISWHASNSGMVTESIKLRNKLDSVVDENNILNKKHEKLCTKNRNDKNELRNCNEEVKKLKEKMVEDQKLWDSDRINLERKIIEQQTEIDEARNVSKKHEELCSQLMQEKIKMERDLEKINDGSRNLNTKMTEDKKMWDSCMTKLEGRAVGLENELNETKALIQEHENLCTKLRQENTDLENKLKEFDDRKEESQNKISEDGLFFDSCKAGLKGTVAELQGTVAELQDELNETRSLCQKHKKFCTELSQENVELGNKLKESDDKFKELKEKYFEDGNSWNLSKAVLEGTVADLKNELNETRLKHEEFCNQLRDENKHLEEKLKLSDDEMKELKAKMTEKLNANVTKATQLSDSSKAQFEEEINALKEQLHGAMFCRDKYEERCEQMREERRRLYAQVNELQNQVKEFHYWFDIFNSKWELKGSVAELNATRLKVKEFYINLTREKKHMEEKLNELNNKKAELENQLSRTDLLLREQKSVLQKNWKECNERTKDLNAKLGFCDTYNEKLRRGFAGILYEERRMSQGSQMFANNDATV